MEIFSIRDLRERTGEPVREAEAGHVSIVAKDGRPLRRRHVLDGMDRDGEGGMSAAASREALTTSIGMTISNGSPGIRTNFQRR